MTGPALRSDGKPTSPRPRVYRAGPLIWADGPQGLRSFTRWADAYTYAYGEEWAERHYYYRRPRPWWWLTWWAGPWA